MNEIALLVTMASVFIGFLLFGASYYSFSYKKPQKVTWTLFCLAVVFLTIVPTTVAVGWAA